MIQAKIYERISNSGKSKTVETYLEDNEWQGFGHSLQISKEQVVFATPVPKDLMQSRGTEIKYRNATEEEINVFKKFQNDFLERRKESEIEYNKLQKEKEIFGNKEILGFKIKDICEKVSNEFNQKGKAEDFENDSLEKYTSIEIVSVFLNLYFNIPIKWIKSDCLGDFPKYNFDWVKNIPRLEDVIFVADIIDTNNKFIILNGEIRYKLQILLEKKLDPEDIFAYNFIIEDLK